MKFTYTALLGAVSANFLQVLQNTADAPEDFSSTAEWKKYAIAKGSKVGEMQCQPH
jgi:hypothetical protein